MPIGTSSGKYGEFANIGGTIFSVNRRGYVYAKADTEKGEKLLKGLQMMVDKMVEMDQARSKPEEEEE